METGLGRGGIDVAELGAALVRLRDADGVVPSALWTHLQAPEDPDATAIQLARFDEASRILAASGLAMPRHVSASAGVLTGIVPAYEGFRPGLAIYGLVPDELDPASAGARAGAGLRPALSLHARPVRVADLPAGWGISYGPAFRTERPSRIATLPFGYGDGWSSSLSNRAEALVRGVRVPIVGRVAMDAVMVDVTDVPGPPVDTADAFVLIGRQGDEAITVGGCGAAAQHECLGSRDLDGSAVTTGVPCRVRTFGSADTHRMTRASWLGSSSGTAISATSRSTPS